MRIRDAGTPHSTFRIPHSGFFGRKSVAYITNEDIEKRMGTSAYLQLADDNGDGTADAPVVDEARLGAEGEVNGYLAGRFAVPIDVAARPELAGLLASITLDLAEHRLRGRRPPVPDDVTRKRREAVAWLEGVAAGRITLPAEAELPARAAAGITAKAVGPARLLTPDELKDF
jgi:phage gp36-like protein